MGERPRHVFQICYLSRVVGTERYSFYYPLNCTYNYIHPTLHFQTVLGCNSRLCKYQVSALLLATLGATCPALNPIVYIIQNQGDFQNSAWDMELANFGCRDGRGFTQSQQDSRGHCRDPLCYLLIGKRDMGSNCQRQSLEKWGRHLMKVGSTSHISTVSLETNLVSLQIAR